MRNVMILAIACFVVSGCGSQESYSVRANPTYESIATGVSDSVAVVDQSYAMTQAPANRYAETPAEATNQRIIYTGDITLVVKDFDKAKQEIEALLKSTKGFVANFTDDRTYGDQRSGHWVVRVPVSAFHGFVEDLAELGVAESQGINGQDVTEEFVDLEARLKNQRVLEERMLKLLADRGGAIKDIIAVEEQLARVRGEIERMEGRLRYLKDRTEFTTVTIDVREDRSYVPPAPPTLTSRVSGAWGDSLGGLQVFGENLLITLVAAIPWLCVIGVIVLPTAWGIRRKMRSASTAK